MLKEKGKIIWKLTDQVAEIIKIKKKFIKIMQLLSNQRLKVDWVSNY